MTRTIRKQHLVVSAMIVVLSLGSVTAQNKSVPPNTTRVVVEGRTSIIRLAPGFTTAIRLPETVISVVAGDSTLFQVEHSPNEPLFVFAKPLTATTVQTNLLITTSGGRHFSLLLTSSSEPASSEAVDLLVLCRSAGSWFIEETYPASLIAETLSLATAFESDGTGSNGSASSDSLDELVERYRNRPVAKLNGTGLRAGIGEVIERGSQFVVLFSVVNSTPGPVDLMTPQVQLAGQVRSGFLKQSSRWTTVEQIPVSDFRLTRVKLNPGSRSDGAVVFERPSMKQSNETLLLQIAESAAVDQPVLIPISFTVASLKEEK